MAKTVRKVVIRKKRIRSIRRKISGSSERPRLRVFKSNRHIYAQLIDDQKQITIVSMSTKDKDFIPPEGKGKTNSAEVVGRLIAERAKNIGIEKVVFDRGGYIYHGRVKALSDGARKGGLVF